MIHVGGIRRRLALDRLRIPVGISLRHFVGGLFVPGLGFFLRGPRLWGRMAFLACGFLALVFLLFMGYPFGNIAFGLLIAIHVVGFLYLTQPVMGDARFIFRLGYSVIVLVMISCLLYFPVRNFAQRHWFMPLRTGDKVIIVHRSGALKHLKQGDWVAYSLDSIREPGLYVHAGFGFGPILAVPGDHVDFFPKCFEVNGVPRERLPHMPTDGSLVISQRCWFVWPELARQNYVGATEATYSSALLRLSQIRDSQVVGVPYKRWFWRRQM